MQRFDRTHGARRFYASAMTLLRKTQSEGTSYLELAQFIRAQGDAEHADADLAQLFRRVAFNVAIGNRDDHLRNHGFVLGKTGWCLAPAFDVNPNIDKAEHVLNIDDVDNPTESADGSRHGGVLRTWRRPCPAGGGGSGGSGRCVAGSSAQGWYCRGRYCSDGGSFRGPCRVSCSRRSGLKLFHVSVQHRRHQLGDPAPTKAPCLVRPWGGTQRKSPRASANVCSFSEPSRCLPIPTYTPMHISELVRAWRPRLCYRINNPDPPLPYSDLHMNLNIRRRLRWISMDASGR
ncbi:HipA domain-containing protein [Achromobacter xylosoxidans]